MKIAIFSVIVLIFGFGFGLAGPVKAADDINQQILDLRAQIDALTKQAEQYKGTIAQKQKEADTLKRQIDLLNTQILKLQTSIAITGRRIDSTKLEITNLEGQIFDAQQRINKQKQTVGELLALLYERDQFSLLAVILKSPTISNFTDQAQQEQNLNNRLIQLLADLKVQKDSLESDKAQLDQKQADLEALNNKQIGQQASLNGNKKNKDTILAQTKGQEAQYQKLLNDVEKKQAEFFNELKILKPRRLKPERILST